MQHRRVREADLPLVPEDDVLACDLALSPLFQLKFAVAVQVAIVSAFLALLRQVFEYSSEVFAEEVALLPFLHEVVDCVTGLALGVLAGEELAVSFGAVAQSFIIG